MREEPGGSVGTRRAVVAPLGYRPALDGLRGIAIALVLWHHSLALLIPAQHHRVLGGFLGVDVFLVLSGFLITTLLLERRGDPDRGSLRSFYWRRAVRLLPALVVYLAAHLVMVLVLGTDVGVELRTLMAALTYTTNWAPTFGWDLAGDQLHLWSLALEEQYYLVWPVALLFVVRVRPRIALAMLVSGVALVAVWRSALTIEHGVGQMVYGRTDARFDALLIGSGLALALWVGWRPVRRTAVALAGCGAVVLIGLVVTASGLDEHFFHGGFTVVALAVAGILVGVVQTEGLAARALTWPPLVALGRLSYSLYLWHVMAFAMVVRLMPDPGVVRLMLAGALALLLAWISYHGVERPVLAWANGERRVSPPLPRIWPVRPRAGVVPRASGAVAVGTAVLVLLGIGGTAATAARLLEEAPSGEQVEQLATGAEAQRTPPAPAERQATHGTARDPSASPAAPTGGEAERGAGATEQAPGGGSAPPASPRAQTVVTVLEPTTGPIDPVTGVASGLRVVASLYSGIEPLEGHTLRFVVSTGAEELTCSSSTDRDGLAACDVRPATSALTLDGLTVHATFAGTPQLGASEGRWSMVQAQPEVSEATVGAPEPEALSRRLSAGPPRD